MIKIPFEVTYDAPGLNVAYSVLELQNGVFTQILGPLAMQNPIGSTYAGFFEADEKKSYVIHKAVYTDGIFATIDENYFQSSDPVQPGNADLNKIVESGLSLAFEVTYGEPDLFVAMKIFETTNGIFQQIGAAQAMQNVIGGTYAGNLTTQSGKSYLIHKAVYTDGTFAVLDENYPQGSDTVQSGGVDISVLVPSLGLNKKFVAVPNMAETLNEWLMPMVFSIITKKIKLFKVKEVPVLYNFLGVWQPLTSSQLMLKPEGQRSWNWFMLNATIQLPLKNDDVVSYNEKQYRVKGNTDYNEYGYYYYELVEDWVGSGP